MVVPPFEKHNATVGCAVRTNQSQAVRAAHPTVFTWFSSHPVLCVNRTQNGHTSGAISTVNTPVRKVSGTPRRR
jgi:hypothetical protein